MPLTLTRNWRIRIRQEGSAWLSGSGSIKELSALALAEALSARGGGSKSLKLRLAREERLIAQAFLSGGGAG